MREIPWTPNHGSEQPCRMICYDTETWQDECPSDLGRTVHRLRLGVAKLFKRKGEHWQHRETLRFQHSEQFIAFVLKHCRKREPLWVYAHNGAFDATQIELWNQLDYDTFRLTCPGREYTDKRTGETRKAAVRVGRLAVDNLPFIVECFTDYGSVKWVDTLNYITVPLAALGEWVGLPKLGMPSESASDDDWYGYCERDVDVLAAAVLKLLALWNGRRLGTWQPTIAGLAFSCFRHLEPRAGIVCHGDEPATPEELLPYWIDRQPFPLDAKDVSAIERRSYYAGRVHVAFVGDVVPEAETVFKTTLRGIDSCRPRISGPVTVFDVNGLYPYCMIAYPQPTKLMNTIIQPNDREAVQLVNDFICIADVTVLSPRTEWPVKEDKRTIHARGHFQTTLAGPELRSAANLGCIVQWHNLLVYESGQPYDRFVRYWWDMRVKAKESTDVCTAKLCKSMIVSLAGKLGQRKPMWVSDPTIPCPHNWGAFIYDKGDGYGFRRCRAVAGLAQVEGDRRDCVHTFTAGAAHITACGRTFMRRLWQACPPRSIIYQDTDSLFCLPEAAKVIRASGLVHDNDIGRLKVEGEYNYLSIYGPKNYDKEDTPVVAGLRRNARRIGYRRWEQLVFERSNSIIARQPDGTCHSWPETFSAPGSQPGFSVDEDGWTTPTRLGRW